MRRYLLLVVFLMLVPVAGPGLQAAEGSSFEWSLQTSDGETVNFPYEHDGPVILLFWASWCPYCKEFMPHVQSILDEYGPADGLTIYAIDFRDDGEPLAYLAAQGYGFTALSGGDDVAAGYDIYGTPGLLLFDKDNRLILNLYDVMDSYSRELPEGLTNRQKAARKAPFWAAQLRLSLDELR